MSNNNNNNNNNNNTIEKHVMKYKNEMNAAMNKLNNNNKASWNHNFSDMPKSITDVIDTITKKIYRDEVQDAVVSYLQENYPTVNVASWQAESNHSGGKRKTRRRGRKSRNGGKRKTHRGGKKSRKSRRGGKKSRRATRRRR